MSPMWSRQNVAMWGSEGIKIISVQNDHLPPGWDKMCRMSSLVYDLVVPCGMFPMFPWNIFHMSIRPRTYRKVQRGEAPLKKTIKVTG